MFYCILEFQYHIEIGVCSKTVSNNNLLVHVHSNLISLLPNQLQSYMALEKSLAFLQFLDRFMLCFIRSVGIYITRCFKICMPHYFLQGLIIRTTLVKAGAECMSHVMS